MWRRTWRVGQGRRREWGRGRLEGARGEDGRNGQELGVQHERLGFSAGRIGVRGVGSVVDETGRRGRRMQGRKWRREVGWMGERRHVGSA